MDSLIFHLDKYFLAIVGGSGVTLLLFLNFLKLLAKETKWSGDDKIINMLLGAVNSIKNPKNKK